MKEYVAHQDKWNPARRKISPITVNKVEERNVALADDGRIPTRDEQKINTDHKKHTYCGSTILRSKLGSNVNAFVLQDKIQWVHSVNYFL